MLSFSSLPSSLDNLIILIGVFWKECDTIKSHCTKYLLAPPPLGVALSNRADGSLCDHMSKARRIGRLI
jgi:hypothetical protein